MKESESRAPNEKQILGAKIRAEVERLKAEVRRPYPGGGWELPPNWESLRDSHIAGMFGVDRAEVRYFMTYSRACTHPWSKGACGRCPE